GDGAVFEAIEQPQQGGEDAIAPGNLPDVALDPWDMLKIMVLAVAVGQACEYAQYAQVALQAHPFVRAVEIGEVGGHGKAGGAGRLPVADGPVELLCFFPGGSRVGY